MLHLKNIPQDSLFHPTEKTFFQKSNFPKARRFSFSSANKTLRHTPASLTTTRVPSNGNPQHDTCRLSERPSGRTYQVTDWPTDASTARFPTPRSAPDNWPTNCLALHCSSQPRSSSSRSFSKKSPTRIPNPLPRDLTSSQYVPEYVSQKIPRWVHPVRVLS